MLFSSFAFIIFIFAYIPYNLALSSKHRLALIIVGSTYFYGYWNPAHVFYPHIALIVTFYATQLISRSKGKVRTTLFASMLSMIFLPLLYFKYMHFFYTSVLSLPAPAGVSADAANLPLGISFITFTLAAYIIDVHANKTMPEKSLNAFSAFILFFPHLIAGPILRTNELLPQLKDPPKQKSVDVTFATSLFTVGFIKKIFFADTLATVVDPVYAFGSQADGLQVLLAIPAFSAQIYCDFSGYTDMAIGVALMLGVQLPHNFDRPYAATSLIDFWRRWHKTLSFWFRDYVYIPLGGSRLGLPRQMANLLLTMTLCGIWHGANWTFAIWGAVHGAGLVVNHLFIVLRPVRNTRPFFPQEIGTALTVIFVSLAWVLFRAKDLPTAISLLGRCFTVSPSGLGSFLSGNALVIIMLLFFGFTHRFDSIDRLHAFLDGVKFRKSLFAGMAMIVFSGLAMRLGSNSKFIYFNF